MVQRLMRPDPITGKSLSKPILVCMVVAAALGWGVYEDAWGARPWRRYQRDYATQRKIAMPVALKQIYVADAGIVDRCESCHLGIRQPGGQGVFAGHPDPGLLRIHDPDRFGCTLCHNGNGAATTSVAKAHGQNRDWPWPLFAPKDTEAGCVVCHPDDRVLDHAPTLEAARELYLRRGCAACHRHEEFDRDTDALARMEAELHSLEKDQARDRAGIDRETEAGDNAENNSEARRHYANADDLRRGISAREGQIGDLNDEIRDLRGNRKGSGPNLKDARLKLRKEWIPAWLKDPLQFRPDTRMPVFRLTGDEVRALSAFVWQASPERPAIAPQPRGDGARGKDLFESRGCLGCHSIGTGAARMGSNFAANLSRLGEKANYEFVVRWIHDPGDSGEPLCRGADCVNDPRPAMPKLRLTEEEARDIATYLVDGSSAGPAYPGGVSFMDNRRLAGDGRKLAILYGCPNCHTIAGLEKTPRVGSELTYEGSRPLEQLDFGGLEAAAKREGWYTPEGFFERKMREPGAFGNGRATGPEQRLHMPRAVLTDEERHALALYLTGSVETPESNAFRTIPAAYRYNPVGGAQDIQEGWWIVKRYNCMGCHVMRPGQKSALSTLPWFQDADSLEKMPPPLMQEGARVNPRWLEHFLSNPALNDRDPDRNGIRGYLRVRMPTFAFSDREIRALVKFFSALSGEPLPWIAPEAEPLTERERALARALFSSPAAPCLRCHMTGDPRHDKIATAPDFRTAAERLKPGWTARWMIEPQEASPGTAMPAKLFRREGGRWVLAGFPSSGFADVQTDHVELLVRYMFQWNAEEQRRLMAVLPEGDR
ncbi:MAG: c-type cytochrome [Acidobacteriota bacterium]|nr:c-type cytochrome [Acidobacteriota bacterium]